MVWKILSTFIHHSMQAAFFSFKNNNPTLKKQSFNPNVTSFAPVVGVAAVVALHTMRAGAKNEH